MRSLIPLALVTAAAALVTAQTRPVTTFRSDVNFVELIVSVTGKDDAPVRGLTKADFQVSENGAPQTVSTLDAVDLPMPPPVEPVPGGRRPPADGLVSDNSGADRGRVYAIAIDQAHIDPATSVKVRRQLRQFIRDFMAPDDRAAIITLGSPPRATPFTANRALLDAALAPAGARERTDVDVIDTGGAGGRQASDAAAAFADAVASFQEAEGARTGTASVAALDALARVADFLGGLEGRRKSLIFVSAGVSVMPGIAGAKDIAQDAVASSFGRLVQALQANGITVYALDPEGLAKFDPFDGGGSAGPLSMGFGPAYLDKVAMMRGIADDTGGIPIVGYNAMARPFQRIVDDNSSYYVLGYASNQTLDGRAHPVRVSIVGREDLVVRTRDRVLGTPPEAGRARERRPDWRTNDVPGLLSRPLATDRPGLRLRAVSSVIRWNAGRPVIQVAVETHESGFTFRPAEGAWIDAIDVGVQAVDEQGLSRAARSEHVAFRVRPTVRDAIAARGWRYVTELTVPPGIYQVRVAEAEANGGQSGSVFVEVAAPPQPRGRLMIGGIALASERGSAVPTAGQAATARAAIGIPITASRQFVQDDTLTALMSVGGRAGERVTVVASIVSAAGETLRWAASEGAAASGDAPIALRIPLANVPPGRQTLLITASCGGQTAVRSVSLEVR